MGDELPGERGKELTVRLARHVMAVVLAAITLFASGTVGPPAARAEEPSVADADHRRGCTTRRAVLREVARVARAEGDARRIVVVLDALTFAVAVPGAASYGGGSRLDEVPLWLDAIQSLRDFEPEFAIEVALSDGSAAVAVSAPGWRREFEKRIAACTAAGLSGLSLPPMAALASKRFRSANGGATVGVYITERPPLEPWMFGDAVAPRDREAQGVLRTFRRKLERGAGRWDPEAVGAACVRADARLVVVGTQAPFGSFLPSDDLPQVPLASRPWRAQRFRVTPEPSPSPFGPVGPAGPAGPAGAAGPVIAVESPGQTSVLRLESSPPGPADAFGVTGAFVPRNSSVPSGFGWWAYARATAISSGAYVVYPAPPGADLDPFPVDADLLRALAPESGTAREFGAAVARDPSLRVLMKAQRTVIDVTPWHELVRVDGRPRSQTWCGFSGEGTPRVDADWRWHRKPFDQLLASPPEYRGLADVQAGRKRVAAMERAYRTALSDLDSALPELRRNEGGAVSRRGLANVRLMRFWLAMGRFHIEAFEIFLDYAESLFEGGREEPISPTYAPCIRLSDCLDGYDGRTLGAEAARSIPLLYRPVAGIRSSILDIRPSDPRYRARRSLPEVLSHVHPRLAPLAASMIDAAEEVMAHEARSPWGWLTYYSEANCVALPNFGPPPAEPPPGWTPPTPPLPPPGPPPPPPPGGN